MTLFCFQSTNLCLSIYLSTYTVSALRHSLSDDTSCSYGTVSCSHAGVLQTDSLTLCWDQTVRAALCVRQKSLEKVIAALLPANPLQSHLQQQRNPLLPSSPQMKTIILLVSASTVASVGCHRVARQHSLGGGGGAGRLQPSPPLWNITVTVRQSAPVPGSRCLLLPQE